MRYDIYKTSVDRKLDKAGIEVTWEQMLNDVMNLVDEETGECTSMPFAFRFISESRYIERNRPVIFVESTRLVNTLLNSKFKFDCKSIKVPCGGICSMAFPKNLTYQGIKIKSVLIDISDAKKDKEFFSKYVWYNRDVWHKDYLFYKRITFSVNGYEPVSCELSVFVEVMNKQYKEIKDNTINYIHGRLVASLIYYILAYPECFKPGLPDDITLEKGYKPNQYVRRIVLTKEIENATAIRFKNPHKRREHFRHLWNKRYARDENGCVRMIFVKECDVNGKTTPFTVTERV